MTSLFDYTPLNCFNKSFTTIITNTFWMKGLHCFRRFFNKLFVFSSLSLCSFLTLVCVSPFNNNLTFDFVVIHCQCWNDEYKSITIIKTASTNNVFDHRMKCIKWSRLFLDKKKELSERKNTWNAYKTIIDMCAMSLCQSGLILYACKSMNQKWVSYVEYIYFGMSVFWAR